MSRYLWDPSANALSEPCRYPRNNIRTSLPWETDRRCLAFSFLCSLPQPPAEVDLNIIIATNICPIAEDNMNVQLKDITVTARDGRVSHLDQVYIRGSHVRFFVVPDMLRYANSSPMFLPNPLARRSPRQLNPPFQHRTNADVIPYIVGMRICSAHEESEVVVSLWPEAERP